MTDTAPDLIFYGGRRLRSPADGGVEAMTDTAPDLIFYSGRRLRALAGGGSR
jgi:hypothetical protein